MQEVRGSKGKSKISSLYYYFQVMGSWQCQIKTQSWCELSWVRQTRSWMAAVSQEYLSSELWTPNFQPQPNPKHQRAIVSPKILTPTTGFSRGLPLWYPGDVKYPGHVISIVLIKVERKEMDVLKFNSASFIWTMTIKNTLVVLRRNFGRARCPFADSSLALYCICQNNREKFDTLGHLPTQVLSYAMQ